MTAERERRIRERAYQIWEEEGRPSGRELEHWTQAEGEIAEAEAEAGSTITMSPGGRGRRLRRVEAGAAASAGGGHLEPPRRRGKVEPPG
jgi:hypothetical protein